MKRKMMAQNYIDMKVLFILAAFFPLYANAFTASCLRLTKNQPVALPKQSSAFFPLHANADDNEPVEGIGSDVEKSNFDGEGFAGYLAPYAFAVVASIAVTAAFVKFVLLDY